MSTLAQQGPAHASRYARRVLLSDRDIRAELAAGRLGIDPFDDGLIQPSSVDVRLDNLFRVFNNTLFWNGMDGSGKAEDIGWQFFGRNSGNSLGVRHRCVSRW